MADTAFAAAGDGAGRVAEPLVDKATGKKPPMRNVTRDNRWQSGGGGLDLDRIRLSALWPDAAQWRRA